MSATYLSTMPSVLREQIFSKAKNKTVAFSESDDPRVSQAVQILKTEFSVNSLLVSSSLALEQCLRTQEEMQKLSGPKPLSLADKELAKDPTFAAGAFLSCGQVDAVIAGCTLPTAHVIRAALKTVGSCLEKPLITSCFCLTLKEPRTLDQAVIVFADCGVIPDPTSFQLKQIAYLSQKAFVSWTAKEPKISFLSFSTAGSAKHPMVEKVKDAYLEFKKDYPHILCDGEVQLDAACVPEIALLKNPYSEVKGETNIFVFPNLDAGNIAYKLMQRMAGAQALGPILLGTRKPFSDLSRGASFKDIVEVALLTLALDFF